MDRIRLIVQIGEWVMRQACLEAARWPGHTCVGVNLSPVQFRDTSLSSIVDSALIESGLPPERLVLEVTESVFLDADESVLNTLHALRERGVSFALDDFGTGYSSLSYLRSFPFDKVKIDKSFVRDIAQQDSNLAIVRAITGMARSLGMTVIAEGVETEEELVVLRLEGCTHVQGYLFSRPLSPASINSYIDIMATSGIGGSKMLAAQEAANLETSRDNACDFVSLLEPNAPLIISQL